MKGFINIIKPEGGSSAFAVGAVKKKFHIPCGHMGTLDPMASGVLPVGIGKTSRLFQFMLEKDKEYVAEFAFGTLTDTLDKTGKVTASTDILPTERVIKDSLPFFIGEIDQVPPNYSAKCIDGKRGYELARRGIEFTLKPKKVTVLSFDYLGQTAENTYKFKIACKGGTYIRSLCRDLGERCGSLATMVSLDRTKSGVFDYANGVTLEEFKASHNPEKYLLPADMAVDYKKAILTNAQATKILNGVFDDLGYQDGLYRVYNGDDFWGVGESIDGILKIKAYVR